MAARSLGSAFVTIYAEDKDASAKMDALRAKMDVLAQDISKKRTFNISDSSAKAALDAISVKAARLADKLNHNELDIKGTAKAEAQLSALQLQADRLNSKLGSLSVSSSLRSKLDKIAGSDFFKPSLGGSLLASLPALIPAAAGVSAAVGAIGASFGAASVSAGLFGITAKSVLTSASQDAQKVQALQTKLATATTAAGKKVIQDQITALTQGWTPAYKTIIGDMEDLPNQWKATAIKISASALVPWLDAVKNGLQFLVPLVKPVADEFEAWGKAVDTYFKSKTGSDEIKAMATAFGQFASVQLADLVSFIRDFASGVHNLAGDLSGSGVYFGAFGDHLAAWGAAFNKWSASKQARADVSKFVKYLHDNGGLIVSTVKSLAKLIPEITAGASAVGTAELQAINGLLGFIGKLPPSWAKPLTEAAGAIFLLSKTGVLKIGFSIVGVGAKVIKWLTGGSTAAIGAAGMQAAGDTMAGAAAAMQKAADTMVGADAAGGAGGAGGTAGKAAGGGLLSRLLPAGLVAGAGYVAGGLLIGGVIKGAGDALAPKGTDAGKLNKTIQSAFAGIPGINIFSGFIAKSAPALGNFLTQSQKKASDTFGAMGSVSSRYAGPAVAAAKTVHDQTATQQDKMQAHTSQTFGAMGSVAGRLVGPLVQPFKNTNTVGSQQFDKLQGNVKNSMNRMQGSIDLLHGKSVDVTAHGSASGNITFAQQIYGQNSKGYLAFHAKGALIPGSGNSDSVPAMLTPGEVVVPKGMVQAGMVDHLRGLLPGFASGGFVAGSGFMANAEADFMRAEMSSAIKAAVSASKTAFAAGAPGALGGPTSAGAAAAQSYARSRLGAYGWGASQMSSLIPLWNQESGWNRLARNPSSGAYGIPQALPPGKMGAAANPPLSSAAAQINWGLSYIRGRYGSPAGAEAHELAYHWYAKGGLVRHIDQALGAIKGHPGLPQRYTSLEIQLGSWAARVAQDKELRKAGVHHTGLAADERHVRDLRKALAPLYHQRHIVRRAQHLIDAQERALPGEISAAHDRGMGKLAGTLTHRLNRDKGLDKTFSGWLNRLGPAYTRKEQRADTGWIDSLINNDAKGLGLPIGSFDKGGWLPTGLSLAYNGLGRPERVGGTQTVKLEFGNMPTGTAFERAIGEIVRHFVIARGGDPAVALGTVN